MLWRFSPRRPSFSAAHMPTSLLAGRDRHRRRLHRLSNSALSLAAGQIETGRARSALVIGADVLSRVIDYGDKRTAGLFGDGAGAAVAHRRRGDGEIGPVSLRSDGGRGELIRRHPRGAAGPDGRPRHLPRGGRRDERVTQEVVSDAGIALDEIDLFVYHQANSRIISAVGERLDLPPDRSSTASPTTATPPRRASRSRSPRPPRDGPAPRGRASCSPPSAPASPGAPGSSSGRGRRDRARRQTREAATGDRRQADAGCALVTGASRGIGAATASALAEDGWSVAVNYSRDRDGAESVASSIEEPAAPRSPSAPTSPIPSGRRDARSSSPSGSGPCWYSSTTPASPRTTSRCGSATRTGAASSTST